VFELHQHLVNVIFERLPGAWYCRIKSWHGSGAPLQIPVSKDCLGRLLNIFGEPLDGKPAWLEHEFGNIHAKPLLLSEAIGISGILEAGIKVIDLLCPFVKGRKTKLFGGTGVGERIREAHELWKEMQQTGVMQDTLMIFGQMDESPGVRFRVGLSALTYVEYLRDTLQKEVLFVVDNAFRFVQAGSEISSLLGRMPAKGWLSTDLNH
jgi:F-type H+-transporting ATPase subunit beta